MRRLIAIAFVSTLAVTGAACSNNEESTASRLGETRAAATKAKAKAARTTSASSVPFVNATEHTPGTLKKFSGAKSDVHDSTCGSEKGTWKATGKVTNPTKSAVRYRIYVSFLAGDTTVALGEADFGPVAAGATKDWRASVKTPATGVRCILRVERAPA